MFKTLLFASIVTGFALQLRSTQPARLLLPSAEQSSSSISSTGIIAFQRPFSILDHTASRACNHSALRHDFITTRSVHFPISIEPHYSFAHERSPAFGISMVSGHGVLGKLTKSLVEKAQHSPSVDMLACSTVLYILPRHSKRSERKAANFLLTVLPGECSTWCFFPVIA